MLPQLKSDAVTARLCEEKYKALYNETNEPIYRDLSRFATETKRECDTVIKHIEKGLLRKG